MYYGRGAGKVVHDWQHKKDRATLGAKVDVLQHDAHKIFAGAMISELGQKRCDFGTLGG